MHVEIWSDISCPWCFVGKARFDKALSAFPHRDHVEVTHRSFELDPQLAHTGPTTGAAHAKKYGLTSAEARAAEENLAGIARKEGLDYLVDFRDHGNTFDLHRLLHLAAARGLHDELLTLFYQGNFAAKRSIYDSEHQVEIAIRAGLDEAEVRAVLADRRAYADEVRGDEGEAAQLGITSVPFFVIDRKYGVSGAQSVEAFSEVLRRAWVERQPELTVLGAGDQAGCDAHGCELPSGGSTGEPSTPVV
ncbi:MULTISPECIES: DsbA family oxidoreductase [unclassified Micromonospora]|uniref:DsbA family oxidoreductase n=1 Tax=unclassified Micromonospora TaxID=2617518 RepID=UPI0022B6FFCF|nr:MULTISPECIES: DsbA family oxidoreductase [unclassified Micromonospora]MCZ7421893.1 DsbA family oxidoreductase [Verrucosispora sp. WMMA2121]WBB93451.1 DsbA family oxidoreductase [Verrucosispora sp. WMMC514]